MTRKRARSRNSPSRETVRSRSSPAAKQSGRELTCSHESGVTHLLLRLDRACDSAALDDEYRVRARFEGRECVRLIARMGEIVADRELV